MRKQFIVTVLLMVLMSGCKGLSEDEIKIIRSLTPAINCWKYQLKVGRYLGRPLKEIRESTEQELQKIYRLAAVNETDISFQAREKVLSVWATRHRLDDEVKRQIYRKVVYPGTCELNIFPEN